MSSVEFMRDIVRPNALAAAQAAGRSAHEIGFPMGALVSVNHDPEKARRATAARVCGLFHPVPHPYYDSQLRQLGFADVADDLYGLSLGEADDAVRGELYEALALHTDWQAGPGDEALVAQVLEETAPAPRLQGYRMLASRLRATMNPSSCQAESRAMPGVASRVGSSSSTMAPSTSSAPAPSHLTETVTSSSTTSGKN